MGNLAVDSLFPKNFRQAGVKWVWRIEKPHPMDLIRYLIEIYKEMAGKVITHCAF